MASLRRRSLRQRRDEVRDRLAVEIVKLWKEGMPWSLMAERFGRSATALRWIALHSVTPEEAKSIRITLGKSRRPPAGKRDPSIFRDVIRRQRPTKSMELITGAKRRLKSMGYHLEGHGALTVKKTPYCFWAVGTLEDGATIWCGRPLDGPWQIRKSPPPATWPEKKT